MTAPEIVVAGVFGLMVGSFLNVCIARLPSGGSIVSPSSSCPKCGRPINWRDNIPVLSYLMLGGKCRACSLPISVRYPLVEVTTAVLFMVQAMAEPVPGVHLASRLAFTALLVALAVTDLETFRLPNPLTIGGVAAGLVFALFTTPGFTAGVIGAALGGGILLLIRWGWLRATGKDAMGLGDVKMLAMIGAFLGWQQVFVVLLLSTLAGALVGIGLTVAGRGSMGSRLPFGVFLASAALVASLVGQSLLAWYLGLLVV